MSKGNPGQSKKKKKKDGLLRRYEHMPKEICRKGMID